MLALPTITPRIHSHVQTVAIARLWHQLSQDAQGAIRNTNSTHGFNHQGITVDIRLSSEGGNNAQL